MSEIERKTGEDVMVNQEENNISMEEPPSPDWAQAHIAYAEAMRVYARFGTADGGGFHTARLSIFVVGETLTVALFSQKDYMPVTVLHVRYDDEVIIFRPGLWLKHLKALVVIVKEIERKESIEARSQRFKSLTRRYSGVDDADLFPEYQLEDDEKLV